MNLRIKQPTLNTRQMLPKATSFDLDEPASNNPSLPHTIEDEKE
jgi:hypothetical protein